jgi:hypothetical protein
MHGSSTENNNAVLVERCGRMADWRMAVDMIVIATAQ